MKKIVGIVVALAMLCTMASALEFAEGTGYNETSGTIVALYTGYGDGQATMLAYDVTNVDGATVDTAFVDTTTTPIIGIDQEAPDGTFEFAVPENYTGKVVLMVGGTDVDPIKMLLEIGGGTVEKITFVCGDVNGDGVADGKDASLIMSSTIGGSKAAGGVYEIGAVIKGTIICGDVNGDSVADGKDASLIMSSTIGGSKAAGGDYEIGQEVTIDK